MARHFINSGLVELQRHRFAGEQPEPLQGVREAEATFTSAGSQRPGIPNDNVQRAGRLMDTH